MSSNKNHTISLQNYEEWLILYMDNELSSEERLQVEAFLLLHPHLQEELDLLLSTKLPEESIRFAGKEDLQAAAMKLNLVDEALLLYLDNELPAADKKRVEEKLAADKEYQLQFALLQQTKLDASETIPYPNKKELYRRTERVPLLPMWMRIAVAIVLILFATLFFVLNTSKQSINGGVARIDQPAQEKKTSVPSRKILESATPSPQTQTVAVNASGKDEKTQSRKARKNVVLPRKDRATMKNTSAVSQPETIALTKPEGIKIDAKKLTEQPNMAVNKLVATPSVTSVTPASYNNQNNPEVTADIEGENKSRTPAKGFLRKVSRFLEKRTGIGTVNADNEILVGAVALKLN